MLHQNFYITLYILTVTFILGAIFGSFINCMALRTVFGESVMQGRSHCAVCGHPLSAGDLIPIFSYIFLHGKCRYCGEKISPRYMATEIAMALGFIAIVIRFDVTFTALRYLVLLCILMALSLVDLEKYEIPDRFIIAGIVWWAATMPLMDISIKTQLKDGLIGAFAIAGSMLVLSLIFDRVTGKESLGGGDIKLLFMTGLYLGLFAGLFSLIAACVIGIIFVLVLKQNRIPFGPAISLATILGALFGSNIVNWYISIL